jgi:hypothetical protein
MATDTLTQAQRAELDRRFSYHPPTGTQPERHQKVRAVLRAAAEALSEMTPECREQSLALTHLEQAMFYASAAIARRENPVEEPAYGFGVADGLGMLTDASWAPALPTVPPPAEVEADARRSAAIRESLRACGLGEPDLLMVEVRPGCFTYAGHRAALAFASP